MITEKEIKLIAKNIIARSYPYEYVGLRVQDSPCGLGVGDKIMHLSHRWDDGEMLNETLDGICAVSARLAASIDLRFGAYDGSIILVLGSDSAGYGEDDGEIIMRQFCGQYPVILDIIRTEA